MSEWQFSTESLTWQVDVQNVILKCTRLYIQIIQIKQMTRVALNTFLYKRKQSLKLNYERITEQFWQNLQSCLSNKIENITPFNTHQILTYKKMTFSYTVNIIVIKGRYHIHICKWKNQKPSLIYFKNELKILFFSLDTLGHL